MKKLSLFIAAILMLSGCAATQPTTQDKQQTNTEAKTEAKAETADRETICGAFAC